MKCLSRNESSNCRLACAPPCTPFILLERAFFQQMRLPFIKTSCHRDCLQLLKPDQDILHNIFCFAFPWLFKFLCPGGWPVKGWTAHLASTSPSQLQTSRGNSHLSDSDKGEFLLKFELGLVLVCSGMFHLQAQAPSCFTRPRAHHFLDASGRLMQKLCGNFCSPTQQNAAGICSTDSTLFIPGWGQQNEHLLQHLPRHAPGIKSVEFPKPFLLQSLFFGDQLVCSTCRRF